MAKLRWSGVVLLLFMVIAVDFTSKIMSVVADALLVGGVIALALPALRAKRKY